MSEIQSAANPDWIKYGVGVISFLFISCSALIIYIFRNLQNNFDDFRKDFYEKYKFIRSEQKKDHDMLGDIYSEHKIFHDSKIGPKNT